MTKQCNDITKSYRKVNKNYECTNCCPSFKLAQWPRLPGKIKMYVRQRLPFRWQIDWLKHAKVAPISWMHCTQADTHTDTTDYCNPHACAEG